MQTLLHLFRRSLCLFFLRFIFVEREVLLLALVYLFVVDVVVFVLFDYLLMMFC